MTLGVLHSSSFRLSISILAQLGPNQHQHGDCLGVCSGPSAPPWRRQCSRAAAQRVNFVGCWEEHSTVHPLFSLPFCLLPSPRFPVATLNLQPSPLLGKSKPGRQDLAEKSMENLLTVAAKGRHVIYRARKLCRIGLTLVRPDHGAGSLPAKPGMSLFWDPFVRPLRLTRRRGCVIRHQVPFN